MLGKFVIDYKQSLALQNGYSVIRIVQKHIWEDLIDWKTELKNGIELIKSKFVPSIHYISEDDRYYNLHYGYFAPIIKKFK
jgi:hypothetical protein